MTILRFMTFSLDVFLTVTKYQEGCRKLALLRLEKPLN